MTKKEYFATLKAIDAVAANPELVAFIDHEVELIDKKNASRKNEMTENQKANAALADQFYDFLVKANGPVTVAAIRKQFDLSSQKASAILGQMKDSGLVTKVIEKRVSYYTAVVQG